jgi:hypothetical protein
MALIKSIKLLNGIELKDGYFKIFNIMGDKNMLSLNVQIYFSKEHCDNTGIPIAGDSYSFKPAVLNESENFLKQGYDYLKTLPEFKDAIDA